MRTSLGLLCAAGLALALSGCGSGSQTATNTTNIEEMGPEGGSNEVVTPAGNAADAPVGSADNGNVLPGDANPQNPRDGGNVTTANSQ